MRTPNTYGYFTATYTPIKPLSIALSGTYTGSMLVPHEPVPGFLEKTDNGEYEGLLRYRFEGCL